MSTWFCLASGPSQNQEDVNAIRGRGRVIAINNTVFLAPWADILYSCDPTWWREYKDRITGFRGERLCLNHAGLEIPDGVQALPFEHREGLGLQVVNTGNNSGYQAINYAYLHGAKTIILLGYDMQHTGGKRHFHPDHPAPLGNFGVAHLCAPKFTQLASDLGRKGVRVINATRCTALQCFERMPLSEALAQI